MKVINEIDKNITIELNHNEFISLFRILGEVRPSYLKSVGCEDLNEYSLNLFKLLNNVYEKQKI